MRSGTISRVEVPDTDLVGRAQRGDAAAFEALVARHAPYVYNLALRTLDDPVEAEDAAQEAFVRAWRGLPRFRAEARFSTWLYRIAVNACYNRLPSIKASLEALDIHEGRFLPDERQRADAGLLADELRDRLHAAIEALPRSYRLLVTLRHVHDMSYADIAAVTGLPLGTVKTGIHRARQQLRVALTALDAPAPPPRDAEPARAPDRPSHHNAPRLPAPCARFEVNHA